MIDSASIREIIEVYTKHGWTLRRVLLSDGMRREVGSELKLLFGNASVRISDIDAAWFSRATKKDGTAWEIRHLSAAPFALLIVVNEEQTEPDDAMLETEERLRETVNKRMTSH